MIIMMRTTINLPDDVYEAARSLANARRISLGEAIGELVRRSNRPPAKIGFEGRVPVAILPEDSPIITLEHSLRIEDELD
jgi:hypothetical protein